VLVFASAIAGPAPSVAWAAGPPPSAPGRVSEAESHFRRGVALYKEADFQSASVEFKRAYDLAPNYRILYNLGQAYFQMQRYASALQAFEGYLTQGGNDIPPARRAQVESDRKQLESRVGRLEVSVDVDGAEVRIDDETVGTSPLKEPVLVSIGRRKVTVMKPGRMPLERFIDIAAGDKAKLRFEYPAEPAPAPAASAAQPPPSPPPAPPPAPEPAPNPPPSHGVPWVPWVVTGVLAAGTATTGVLTLSAKSDLTNKLGAFPGDPQAIDNAHSKARTMATVTDVLLGATVVSAAVSIWLTLKPDGGAETVQVGVGPGSVGVRGAF
jgi:hypothetical protein